MDGRLARSVPLAVAMFRSARPIAKVNFHVLLLIVHVCIIRRYLYCGNKVHQTSTDYKTLGYGTCAISNRGFG